LEIPYILDPQFCKDTNLGKGTDFGALPV